MTESEKFAFLDALGRETAGVIVAELRKIQDATGGDLLIAMESFVVHALAAAGLGKGKEGRILKQMRENVMQRLAKARMLEGKAQGNG